MASPLPAGARAGCSHSPAPLVLFHSVLLRVSQAHESPPLRALPVRQQHIPAEGERHFIVRTAGSVPHLSHTSTHHCSCLIKRCSLPHPDFRSRAQLQLTNENTISSSVPVPGLERRCTKSVNALTPSVCAVTPKGHDHILPLEGPIAPLLEAPVTSSVSDTVTSLSMMRERWEAITSPAWVLRMISRGYRLQFAAVPPRFSGTVHSQVRRESARVLQEEIHSLLSTRAICIVPPEQCQSGFYSGYFLVPKRGGTGIRPILDLRILNKYLRTYKFRMLTHASLLRMLHQNDWFTSVDLKDAYFHVLIYPPHRKYLRFAFLGVCYEYRMLPFGLSLSPRVFVRCTEAAIAPLRQQNIMVAMYWNDWLLLARSREEAMVQTHTLIKHPVNLGFMINPKKSVISSAENNLSGIITILGVLHSSFVSRKGDGFRACLSRFTLHSLIPFRLCLRLLGQMASAILVVQLGCLYMRDFQRWVSSLRLDPVRHGAWRVTVSAPCVMALCRWHHPTFLVKGVPMGPILSQKVVTTDASMSGWGSICEGRCVRGIWSKDLQRFHINYLELLVVFLTLRTDNTTTVAYINRQREYVLTAITHAGKQTDSVEQQASPVSESHPRPGGSEQGGRPAVQVCAALWGMDTTSSHRRAGVGPLQQSRGGSVCIENAQCPLFFSIRDPGAPLGMDTLAHIWPLVLLYAFPPLALIPPTLDRVREHRHTLILIALHWPAMHWLAELYQLLSGQPWQIPLSRDMLSQAGGVVFHPHPERLALWAWLVSGLI
ncbi:uncharacterized protein LOC111570364 [Amphiprion ocellaris]|uniref:uncharacterized protein LOC111570364 n=1 Tax=Amphiprion ocellaris TaxID=80972 RepID=UPI0024118A4A|nr:uncharacterized protein LOC111570364 [Amphiprion ocellaris]